MKHTDAWRKSTLENIENIGIRDADREKKRGKSMKLLKIVLAKAETILYTI